MSSKASEKSCVFMTIQIWQAYLIWSFIFCTLLGQCIPMFITYCMLRFFAYVCFFSYSTLTFGFTRVADSGLKLFCHCLTRPLTPPIPLSRLDLSLNYVTKLLVIASPSRNCLTSFMIVEWPCELMIYVIEEPCSASVSMVHTPNSIFLKQITTTEGHFGQNLIDLCWRAPWWVNLTMVQLLPSHSGSTYYLNNVQPDWLRMHIFQWVDS